MWACGAAGSALPWHGRGRRFDPDQVHQKHPEPLLKSFEHPVKQIEFGDGQKLLGQKLLVAAHTIGAHPALLQEFTGKVA